MPPPMPAGAALAFFSSGISLITRLGGEHQAGDRRGVLQGGADDLGRVDDAGLDMFDELLGLGVEALVLLLGLDLLTMTAPS